MKRLEERTVEPLLIPARTLGTFLLPGFCPRCLWIALHCQNKLPFQIPMPGIFSSIDAYGKNLIHSFFDENKSLPKWFPDIGKVKGYVPGRQLHWSKFKIEHVETKIILRGTPDDIFRLDDDSFHIVDYKTAKVTETQDELFPLYMVQLNVYAYICQMNGPAPVSGLSLIYTEPLTKFDSGALNDLVSPQGFILNFGATLKPVEMNSADLIPDLLRRARTLYDEADPPEGRDGCKNCELLKQLISVAQS
jgi:hypothetical protein